MANTQICLCCTKCYQISKKNTFGKILAQKTNSPLHLIRQLAPRHGTRLLDERNTLDVLQNHTRTLATLRSSAEFEANKSFHRSCDREPSTPHRWASSAGDTRSRDHTFGVLPTELRTPRARRQLKASWATRNNPATPHAIRALQHRRITPSRDRRKIAHTQRETPRDALRNLSKSRNRFRPLYVESG